MTADRIDIICDDPHHARGKIAKVQSFAYYADTGSWVAIPHRSRSRAYRHPGEPPTPFRPNVVGAGPRFVTATSASCAPAGRGAPRWNAPTKHCNGCWTPLRRRA